MISKRLPPGHYLITPDPGGELSCFGVRMRILQSKTVQASTAPPAVETRRTHELLLIIAALTQAS